MFGPWKIPSVGEVQLSWVPNPPVTAPAPAAPTEKNGSGEEDQDTLMQSTPAVASPVQNEAPARDMDYDVAEDEGW